MEGLIFGILRYILQSPWSYRREVWCSPAGDEITNPGLNCTIVPLHHLFITYIFVFQLYLGTYARTVLFCARALFIYSFN